MNRPQYRNAQSRMLLEALDDAFARAVADPRYGSSCRSAPGSTGPQVTT
jgi:enoyl-CoA hydratase/carnithine racemase